MTTRRVVILSVAYGGGHEEVAGAVARRLVLDHGSECRVLVLDLFERHVPRLVPLAAMAYATDPVFYPDGHATFAQVASRHPDDAVVRALASGGLAATEAALVALAPDAVVSVHPVAAGVASELARSLGFLSALVLAELAPSPCWTHPDTTITCVASPEIRDFLGLQGVAYSSLAVTGIPTDEDVFSDRADDVALRAVVAGRGGKDALALARSLGHEGVDARAETGRSKRATAGAGIVGPGPTARAMAAVDVAVCLGGGAALWTAPAAGVPLVVVDPVAAQTRLAVDLLVNAGAAIEARDAEDAVSRVRYLRDHRDRIGRMGKDAAAVARPGAVRAVVERLWAAIR